MENTTPKFVRWAVLLGIVVLLNVFAFIGIDYVFPSPDYNDHFPRMEESCYSPGNACEDRASKESASEECLACLDAEEAARQEAQESYESARAAYAQKAFLAFLAIGALALLAGVFLKGSSIVAAGLSYGGVIMLFVGGARHLGELNQLVQLGAVGAALIIIIVIAYRKFKD